MTTYDTKDNSPDAYIDDFWYDVSDGGYLKPEKYLKNESDIIEVRNAIAIVKKLQTTLELLSQ